jgi:hypothetical protein
MVNLSGHEVHQCEAGWVPVFTDSSQTLGVMSIGFLLSSENDAVVWRGPKKNAMIKQVNNLNISAVTVNPYMKNIQLTSGTKSFDINSKKSLLFSVQN